MHLSASGGHYDLMQYLMEMGASLEDEDKVNYLPNYMMILFKSYLNEA